MKLKDDEYCIVAGVSNTPGREFIVVLDPRDPQAAVKEMPFHEFQSIWSGRVVFVKRVYKLTDEDQPFGLLYFLLIALLSSKNLINVHHSSDVL